MLRILLLLVLLILVVRLLSRLLRGIGAPVSKANGKTVAHMVRCAQCGVFVPVADAFPAGDVSYCSDAHRRLGPAQTP